MEFQGTEHPGGRLLFPRYQLAIQAQAGRLVVFPSGWTHDHVVLPWGPDEEVVAAEDDDGVRWSLVTWFLAPCVPEEAFAQISSMAAAT